MWTNLHAFYTSREWSGLRSSLMLDRVNEHGMLLCECCGDVIVKSYDCIGHHVVELTLDNVNDYDISLNPDNVQLVHHRCHNKIHERFTSYVKRVYLVHGAPLSGKSTFVRDNALPDDLIIDLDNIYQCIGNGERYENAPRLKQNAFMVRDCLLDMVRTRCGKWRNAWIVGGHPLLMERERLMIRYGAESIHIDTDMNECLERCSERPGEWVEYVKNYFEKFQSPPG